MIAIIDRSDAAVADPSEFSDSDFYALADAEGVVHIRWKEVWSRQGRGEEGREQTLVYTADASVHPSAILSTGAACRLEGTWAVVIHPVAVREKTGQRERLCGDVGRFRILERLPLAIVDALMAANSPVS